MIGTTLAHYRITGELGAGGMGEVWRAEDTKLGRDVALKVLSEEFADNAERLERFEREARAVASLNHPHIVTIHSVEEAEGVRFLTMELVDGQTLDALIPKDGLGIERFFDLATPLAEAVSAAHDKSVIHRDLKPTNVMVDRDGRIKVMDFGLAKVAEAGEVSDSSELPTEAMTGIGMVVGTVPYMSPEQIEGEIVDHRTDIFSLGVLLYEMTIGERPFQGKSSPALMSSILKDVPIPVVELRSDLPRHLGRIIGRCLEKDRRDRYQTARDVFNELKALQRESSSSTGMAATSQPRIENHPTTASQPSSDPHGIAGASSVSGTTRQDEGFWVAVLPFKCSGSDSELEGLAEGLSEEIGTGLSRFSYLRVIARGSAARDPRYVIEGSLRRAGTKLRIAVQLVDKISGAHLWAETYDRPFIFEEIFALQDELVPRIVSTVGDAHGVLPHTMSELLRGKAPEDLTPYEAVLRSFGYGYRRTPEEHAAVQVALERAVEEEPRYADAWAMLALVYVNELAHGYNLQPDPLGRALRAARRAADAAPSNATAFNALAWTMFFRREMQAFRTAAEQSIALNPLSSPTLAGLGALTAYSGDWEHGCALVERALELNPRHPGWYWLPLFYDAYRKGDYRGAVNIAFKINLPEFFVMHEALAAAYGQLGEPDAAGKALQEMVRLKPDYATTGRERLEKWFDQELVEHMMDGLHKAGLDSASGARPKDEEPTAETGGPAASVAPSVAVLPFINMSDDRENEFFSDGLSEEIINALTRVPDLRVIARTSAFRFRGEQDLRKVGETLGVRNVLEGSVRRVGERLRITAQLIEVADDSHIWSERFDREMTDVFEIQDEIAGAIAEKLQVSLGISETERPPTPNIEAYEALLEARHFFLQFTPTAAERALASLERALVLDPDYPDALVMHAFYHLMMAYMFADPRDALPNVRAHAERALQLDPRHGEAQAATAVMAVFWDRDWSASELLFRRALELSPASARVHELYGLCCLLGQGRFAEALAELDRAIELDPLSALYLGNRGRVLTCSRQFAEAEESCRRGLAIDPGQLLAQVELTYALLFQDKFDEAVAVGKRAIETHGPVNAPRQALALSYALAGQRDSAMQLVNDTAEPGVGYRSPLALGLVHAAFSEMDEAFACAEQSFEERDPLLIYLAVHPMFDNLRTDPRYLDLLKRMNLGDGETT